MFLWLLKVWCFYIFLTPTEMIEQFLSEHLFLSWNHYLLSTPLKFNSESTQKERIIFQPSFFRVYIC